MPSRHQVTLDRALERRAKKRAQDLGVSFSEYVRRLIRHDLPGEVTGLHVIDLVGIGDSGGSDIRNHEDEYLDEAFASS